MKKVLVITYYWPPVSSPGVQRWLKFAKYLREFEIEPIILTVKNAAAPSIDESLMHDVPDGLQVYRTAAWEPTALFNRLVGKKGGSTAVGLGDIQQADTTVKRVAKYLRSNVFIPDAKVGWYYAARGTALDIVNKERIDTIITTGPPHTAHLIGRYVKKKSPSTRWISDFRDPWTGLYYEKYLSRSAKSQKRNADLEQAVLSESDHVITVSAGMKRAFEHTAQHIEVIPNGYDIADIPTGIIPANKACTLLYTGNLKATQHIPAFWRAVRNVSLEQPLSMTIIGNVADNILATIIECQLSDVVTIKPFLPHREAVTEMMKADLLWLPIPQASGNRSIITGKIFEYLASRTPIFSVGPTDGDAAKILRQCDRDQILAYDDEQSMTTYLREKIIQWRADGEVPKHQNDKHMMYERKKLTSSLADLIMQT